MQAADAQKTVRRVLVSIFVAAEILGVGGAYLLMRRHAVQEAEQQARVVLVSAEALRDYTSKQVLPSLAGAPGPSFHEVTVPSFAAQTVFRSIAARGRAYTYRESALDPTNPQDRATPFEVELVRRFQAQGGLKEVTGLTEIGGEQAFYVAHPFRITDARCLACHSTPAAAPPTMVAKYGSGNGFDWKMGDTVGVQLLTIPVASQFGGALQVVGLLSLGLLVVLGAAYFALSRALDHALVAPLRGLADAADAASRSGEAAFEPPQRGAAEVLSLGAAIGRLRASLRLAMARLAEIDRE